LVDALINIFVYRELMRLKICNWFLKSYFKKSYFNF